MTPQEVFEQQLYATPEDETLRLIYADWLEEHGDDAEFAGWLRGEDGGKWVKQWAETKERMDRFFTVYKPYPLREFIVLWTRMVKYQDVLNGMNHTMRWDVEKPPSNFNFKAYANLFPALPVLKQAAIIHTANSIDSGVTDAAKAVESFKKAAAKIEKTQSKWSNNVLKQFARKLRRKK